MAYPVDHAVDPVGLIPRTRISSTKVNMRTSILILMIVFASHYTLNAQSRTIRLDGSATYSLSGNQVSMSIEHVINYRPAGTSSGTLRMEVWLSQTVYEGGTISGWLIGHSSLGVLQGLSQLDDVSRTENVLTLPPYGDYYIILTISEWSGSNYLIEDYYTFPETTQISPLRLNEPLGYTAVSPFLIRLTVSSISNQASSGNVSGDILLELWAFPDLFEDDFSAGNLLATATFDPLAGGFQIIDINRVVNFTRPPDGDYSIYLFLKDRVDDSYRIDDYRKFPDPWSFVTPLPTVDIAFDYPTEQQPRLDWDGRHGYSYTLQYSPDLETWTPLETFDLTVQDAHISMADSLYVGGIVRFYRVSVAPL